MSLKHVILVLAAEGEISGYDMVKRFDEQLGHVWSASHQQVYQELKRLREAGWIDQRVVDQPDRPDKKLYRLTESGDEELRRWLAAPVKPPPVRDPLLVKFFAGDRVRARDLLAELDDFRRRQEGRLAALRGIEAMMRGWSESNTWRGRLMYIALRRGLLAAEAAVAWAREAQEVIEAMRSP